MLMTLGCGDPSRTVIDSPDAESSTGSVFGDSWSGRSEADADQVLDVEAGGLDYYVAAIRELFEETGVLLANVKRPEDDLAEMRERLNCNSRTWTEFVRETGARMLCNELHYFSHWITPDQLPKRYSTRFFVAELPAGQVAYHDERELTNSMWITAADALRAGKDGTIDLYYPTRTTLQSIAMHENVAELVG